MSKLNRRSFLQYSAGAAVLASMGKATSAIGQEAKIIRTAWWGGTARHDKMNAIFDAFEAANPGVTISREPAPFGSFWERIPTQFAGGNAPDLLWMTEQHVVDYAQAGRVMDLRDLEPMGLDLSGFRPADLEARAYEGKIVRLPIGDTGPATMANTKMFEEAGIDLPTDDWTWDQFRQAAIDLSAALGNGRYGVSYRAGDAGIFDGFLSQDGKSLFAPNGAPELNFEAADAERYFSEWKSLLDEGGCVPVEIESETQSGPFEDMPFARGQCAILIQNSNQLVTYSQTIKANLGDDVEVQVTMLPRYGANKSSTVKGTDISVNAATQYPEEVARLITFFFTDPGANEILGFELGAPPNQVFLENVLPHLTPTELTLAEYHQRNAELLRPVNMFPRGGQRINGLFSELGLAVGFGQVSPADAAGQIVDEMARAIS